MVILWLLLCDQVLPCDDELMPCNNVGRSSQQSKKNPVPKSRPLEAAYGKSAAHLWRVSGGRIWSLQSHGLSYDANETYNRMCSFFWGKRRRRERVYRSGRVVHAALLGRGHQSRERAQLMLHKSRILEEKRDAWPPWYIFCVCLLNLWCLIRNQQSHNHYHISLW